MKSKLVIFDMDGVLIDSEPWWNVAIRNGFRKVGLEMSDEMCEETMGARLNEVVEYRVKKHKIDIKLSEDIENWIEDEIVHFVKTEAPILKGVKESIALLKKEGFSLAIASSSPHRLIKAVIEKLNVSDDFRAIFSAQDDPLGKPHPSVYIRCAATLGFSSENCIVIEDSVNGMVAAKAAKMKVIVVPDPKMYANPAWGLAEFKLKSLLELDPKKHFE